MSLEKKDRWWFDNVFKGDMPQLTVRSAVTGMGLGLILSLTNLYVGMMTGWTLGVGITSVILSFTVFKVLSRDWPGYRDQLAGKQRYAVHCHECGVYDCSSDIVHLRVHAGDAARAAHVPNHDMDHRAGDPWGAGGLSLETALHQ